MYAYTQNDLIENPITYEYSLYSGEAALKEYEDAREDRIAYFRKGILNIQDVQDADTSINHILHSYFPVVDGTNDRALASSSEHTRSISTHTLFLNMLSRGANQAFNKNDERIILIFIKKFEVTKRIWNSYTTKSYKRVDDNYNDLLPYLLFANILTLYIDFTSSLEKKTIAFNSLLKINDTISSVYTKIRTYLELNLALISFRAERDIYLSFCHLSTPHEQA